MRGSPKQYRLMLEEGASFAVLQYALHDKASLIGLIADGDQLRLLR